MRITSNMFAESFIIETQKLQKKQIDAQVAISSGQRIQTSSDDPAAFRQSLEIQSSQRATIQYQDNIRDLESKIQVNHGYATQVHEIITRASEILTRVNASYTATETTAVANELDGLLQQAVNMGNAQQDGQFLFGGTDLLPGDTDPGLGTPYVPFAVTLGANAEIASVAYRGNFVTNRVEIDPNTTVESNMMGFSTASRYGMFSTLSDRQLFQTLIDTRNQFRNGDKSGVAGDLSNLKELEDHIATVIGLTATELSRLKISSAGHEARLLTDETSVSKLLDTDMVKEATNLQRSLSAYEAALQTGARVLNTTLLDYL
jgi:flagellar hook-associated protein 3 FlgL